MNNAYHHPSSELHRHAEEQHRNEERRKNWRAKYTLATGHEPATMMNPVITPREAACIAANCETNHNRFRMQRHKMQRIKGHIIATPER